DHELRALAPLQAEQRRRAEHRGVIELQGGTHGLGGVGLRSLLLARAHHADQMPERRIAQNTPPLELALEEALAVVRGSMAERPRLRLERLHDHTPAPRA